MSREAVLGALLIVLIIVGVLRMVEPPAPALRLDVVKVERSAK